MKVEVFNLRDLDLINSFLIKLKMPKMEEKDFCYPWRKTYVMKLQRRIIGFICFVMLKDEVELEAIYIEEIFQRQGYGQKLIEKMITSAKENGCQYICLEVREHNGQAIKFYKKNGFQEIFNRSHYYGDENGIIMKKELR